jgi:hypothetical protein
MKDIGKGLQVNGIKFETEFWLTADHKFLAIERGLLSANSSNPCLYCEELAANFWQWWRVTSSSSRTKKASEENTAGFIGLTFSVFVFRSARDGCFVQMGVLHWVIVHLRFFQLTLIMSFPTSCILFFAFLTNCNICLQKKN